MPKPYLQQFTADTTAQIYLVNQPSTPGGTDGGKSSSVTLTLAKRRVAPAGWLLRGHRARLAFNIRSIHCWRALAVERLTYYGLYARPRAEAIFAEP